MEDNARLESLREGTMLEVLQSWADNGVISHLDWHFARWIAEKSDSDLTALAAFLTSWHLRQGDICVDLSLYAGRTFRPVDDAEIPAVNPPELNTWINELKNSEFVLVEEGVNKEDEVFLNTRPLVLNGSMLYIGRYWAYEVLLASTIRRLACSELPVDEEKLRLILDELFPSSEAEEPDWQKVATATALMRQLTIISGGPGTGKTYTIAAILVALHRLYGGTMKIALAAPTGKAAARMTESLKAVIHRFTGDNDIGKLIEDDAVTLHRLLRMREGRSTPFYGPDNHLPVDLLIVDEASMVDLPMMYRTVAALKPDARLVLLGDRDQLASVEAGSVFADLCACGRSIGYDSEWVARLEKVTGMKIPVHQKEGTPLDRSIVLLRKNYRFPESSTLGRLAARLRDGKGVLNEIEYCEPANSFEIEEDGKACFRELRPEGLREELKRIVKSWFAGIFECNSPDEALRLFESSRILCAHRDGPFGILMINNLVEDILSREGVIKPFMKYYRGRPVLITRNDYDVRLFNGDIGIVWPDETGRLMAWFRRKDETVRSVGITRLPEHETAFAMTVHKAQGSECDRILFIMPSRESPLLTRELFYTAITRARKYVEIWATAEAVEQAVFRRTIRGSGLYKRIATDGFEGE